MTFGYFSYKWSAWWNMSCCVVVFGSWLKIGCIIHCLCLRATSGTHIDFVRCVNEQTNRNIVVEFNNVIYAPLSGEPLVERTVYVWSITFISRSILSLNSFGSHHYRPACLAGGNIFGCFMTHCTICCCGIWQSIVRQKEYCDPKICVCI